MEMSCGRQLVSDVWSLIEEFLIPRDLVWYREICKTTFDSVEKRIKTVEFLRCLLDDVCLEPPTGKLLDAFLPGVRMLGPHSPNKAPEKLKCKLGVALGFETMMADMLGFTVCGMGTAREFCDDYLPIVWRLCVRGVPSFTDVEKENFLLTAKAIRLVTTRLETGTRKVTVIRLGKGLETHYDIVHQALVISIHDTSSPDVPLIKTPAPAHVKPPPAQPPIGMGQPLPQPHPYHPTHLGVASGINLALTVHQQVQVLPAAALVVPQAPFQQPAYYFLATPAAHPTHITVVPAYTVL
eukprot:TRINITY_DN2526_c0_g1_i1.p1 TRINITY_DN2526_c0_g1~~TRINITY_DN2526_c0_g1_i1.p1  ORF type:complete len:296 (+),score=43.15 TRINITY_DN2526_c0_g1_i1:127-1014(+)